MVARSGDDAVVRHILRIPAVTDEEITVAKARLDSIRSRIIKGDITFSNAVNKYSEDEGAKFSGGQRTGRDGSSLITYDQLDKDLIPLLKGMQPGDVSMPQVYTNERDQRCVRIVFLKSRTEPHRENLRDDFNRVAQRALEEKKEAALAKWFKEHIPTFFITIDNDFAQCGNIEEWRKAAAESNMRTTVKQ
jgi:peptidyl-prolyl cis-trans isomerase SurA